MENFEKEKSFEDYKESALSLLEKELDNLEISEEEKQASIKEAEEALNLDGIGKDLVDRIVGMALKKATEKTEK